MTKEMKLEVLKKLESQLYWEDGKPKHRFDNYQGKFKAGAEAGRLHNKYRELQVKYKGKTRSISGHHLAWFMEYGEVPDMLNHIDFDRDNNRPKNLEHTTSSKNNRWNRAKHYQTRRGKYYSTVTLNKVVHKSPKFDTKEEAQSWYYTMSMYLGLGAQTYF